MAPRGGRYAPIKIETIGTASERQARLEIADFGRQRIDLSFADVGRIGDNEVEIAERIAAIDNFPTIGVAKLNRCAETKPHRIACRDLERFRRDVGGDHMSARRVGGDRKPDRTRAGAEVDNDRGGP